MDVVQITFPVVAGVADPGLRRVRSGVGDPGYRICLFCLFLLLAPMLSAQTRDPVIYPRGSAPADAPAAAAKENSNASLYLAVALLAGAGGWWLWLKRRGGLRSGLAGGAHLKIAESKSLGSRQYLVVADYDGKKFLLGVCPGHIELLTALDGDKARES